MKKGLKFFFVLMFIVVFSGSAVAQSSWGVKEETILDDGNVFLKLKANGQSWFNDVLGFNYYSSLKARYDYGILFGQAYVGPAFSFLDKKIIITLNAGIESAPSLLRLATTLKIAPVSFFEICGVFEEGMSRGTGYIYSVEADWIYKPWGLRLGGIAQRKFGDGLQFSVNIPQTPLSVGVIPLAYDFESKGWREMGWIKAKFSGI